MMKERTYPGQGVVLPPVAFFVHVMVRYLIELCASFHQAAFRLG
jgi:hypothetical protein